MRGVSVSIARLPRIDVNLGRGVGGMTIELLFEFRTGHEAQDFVHLANAVKPQPSAC